MTLVRAWQRRMKQGKLGLGSPRLERQDKRQVVGRGDSEGDRESWKARD